MYDICVGFNTTAHVQMSTGNCVVWSPLPPLHELQGFHLDYHVDIASTLTD